jgi:uncharacterized protein YegP (UPF0339 family)
MSNYKLEIYKDTKKEYRWRMKARNGKIVADGSEGYKNKSKLKKYLSKLAFEMLWATIK